MQAVVSLLQLQCCITLVPSAVLLGCSLLSAERRSGVCSGVDVEFSWRGCVQGSICAAAVLLELLLLRPSSQVRSNRLNFTHRNSFVIRISGDSRFLPFLFKPFRTFPAVSIIIEMYSSSSEAVESIAFPNPCCLNISEEFHGSWRVPNMLSTLQEFVKCDCPHFLWNCLFASA